MPYIVLDLEWNQAMSSKASVFNKLPIRLRGEIIQIGAVKLTEDFKPAEEFQMDIRPVYFRRIHYKVKKLTGFDKERLAGGVKFKHAIEEFLKWCGPDCTFLTWGFDDKNIMEQNLIVHDLDIDWMGSWINLQVIYNLQVDGDRNQKSLATAMEHFGIEQTRVAHDALGDAYNTALVCSRLDLPAGLEQYNSASRMLPCSRSCKEHSPDDGVEPLDHIALEGHTSREDVWENEALSAFKCPDCGGATTMSRWVNQGDKRYISIASCPEHGGFLVRVRLRHCDDGTWSANRLVYRADEKMEEFYRAKSTQNRRMRRRRRKSAKKA
ncbi:MAG: exonuclease domain-containing protein [Candidatus Heteroscillospira sp.]